MFSYNRRKTEQTLKGRKIKNWGEETADTATEAMWLNAAIRRRCRFLRETQIQAHHRWTFTDGANVKSPVKFKASQTVRGFEFLQHGGFYVRQNLVELFAERQICCDGYNIQKFYKPDWLQSRTPHYGSVCDGNCGELESYGFYTTWIFSRVWIFFFPPQNMNNVGITAEHFVQMTHDELLEQSWNLCTVEQTFISLLLVCSIRLRC